MPRTETTTRARAPKPESAPPVEPIAPVETPEQPDPEANARAAHHLEVTDPLPGHRLLIFEADSRTANIVAQLPAGEQAIVGQRLDGALRQILGDKGFPLPPGDPGAGTPPTRGRILTTIGE